MQDYPPIAEHGLIGDLQTAALVSTDGSIDWFCCPRFDSPSVFGSLLDAGKGGHFRIRPVAKDYVVKQLYLPDTAVLVTRFMTEDGVGELLDFMPPTGRQATDNHRLVRLMRCVRGRIGFEADIAPRFDYGRQSHETHVTEHGVVFVNPALSLTLHMVRDQSDERLATVSRTDAGDVRVTFELRSGQQRGVVLESAASGPPQEIPNAEFDRLLEETSGFWRGWLAQSTYTGRWREALQRSAIALKLMTYAPTGALVAAPTAGLPEQVGGERNWDYRYTWIRDGSFSIYALLGMGFTEEAAAFAGWLRDRVEEKVGGEGGPLNIMYRVDGSSDLTEESLDHWEGYRGSRPVRIGNGASDQRQMDIYGEAVDSLHFADQHGLELGHRGWIALRGMIDWLTDNWDQRCEGIWETRGGQKDFTFGRVMSWTALDGAIRLATRHGRPADLDKWTRARDDIYRQVWDKGWSDKRGAFVQHYDNRGPGLVTAPDGDRRLHHPVRPAVALDVAGDGRGAGHGQPRLPLRPGCFPGRVGGGRGHLLPVHVQLRGRTGQGRASRGGPADLREDADVRQPRRPLLRGDRADGRAAGQLPAGVHPPRSDRRRYHAQLGA